MWKVSKYRVFSSPYFPYLAEYGKIQTRKNSVFGHFSRSKLPINPSHPHSLTKIFKYDSYLELQGSITQCLGCLITKPGVLCLNPPDRCMVDSNFQSPDVDKMNLRNSWGIFMWQSSEPEVRNWKLLFIWYIWKSLCLKSGS